MNIAQELEEQGELIEADVIKPLEYRSWSSEPVPEIQILTWEEARPILDREFDDDYGGENGHSFYAWTASRVYFKGTYDGSEWLAWVPRYDGSEWLAWVPRNPTAVVPESTGGG